MRILILRLGFLSAIILSLTTFEVLSAAPLSFGESKNYSILFGDIYSNFLPGSLIRMELTIKNNDSSRLPVSQELVVLDSVQMKEWKTIINVDLGPEQRQDIQLMIPVPQNQGTYRLTLGALSDSFSGKMPMQIFNVIEPVKSPRLSKILIHSPDFEEELNVFLKKWSIKAPAFSWAQVLLLGKKGWSRLASGDPIILQLVSRALRREMSVIILDFNPRNVDSVYSRVSLPYGISAIFSPIKSASKSFVLKSGFRELNFRMGKGLIWEWNGFDGLTVPSQELSFEGKGVQIKAMATSGNNPVLFPVVEIIPDNRKGKLFLCQLFTEGRLEETVQLPRHQTDDPVYDPSAVQFLLNLLSEAVGDNLLK